MIRSSIVLVALLGSSLLSCNPATEEDRKALAGLWVPDDGSRHTVEFKPDGVFDFVYDAGPPSRTVLRLKWTLDTKGKVDIRGDDGERWKTCRYSIEAGKLSIDNGEGVECLQPAVTPPVPMPKAFTKSR
jgi:hypothetical protein